VFKDGLWSTYKKAVKEKVHLVRVTWIQECEKAQTVVSESLFPPPGIEKYESHCPGKRFRRARSLQPVFEDTGEQKVKKRRKKKLVRKPIKVPEFLRTIYEENALVRTLLSVADIGPEYENIISRPDSPTLSEVGDCPISLPVVLLRRILHPKSRTESASSGVEAEDRINSNHVTDGLNCASGAAATQGTISSENIQATTSTVDIANTAGAVENIISENSKYKSSDHTELSNSNIIEVLKNQPVDIENLATGMCSSQSMKEEDQFPNMPTGTRVGKGTSKRKRKLFPLLQCDSPEVLNTDVCTVTDETSYLSLQCPYITERKNFGGKKNKSLHRVGETSVKNVSTCPPSTSSSTKRKCRRGEEGESMKKVSCSSRRSSDEFIRIAKQPMGKEDKPQKMLKKKLPSLVCTGLHRQ